MQRFRGDKASRTIMQVSFYNNATSHTYLIDVNSGDVLLHSQTDVYGAFGNSHNARHDEPRHRSWIFYRFFGYDSDNDKR